MPEPPPVDVLTRFLFENPWPLTAVAAVLGLILAWTALRDGRRSRLIVGLCLFVVAGLMSLTGRMVVTAGEEAEDVVRAFVEAAGSNRHSECLELLHEDATLGSGVTSISLPRSFIERRLRDVARYNIEHVRITSMDAFTTGADEATTHLRVSTSLESIPGIPGSFVLECARDDQGKMRIRRIVVVSIGQLKSRDLARTLGN